MTKSRRGASKITNAYSRAFPNYARTPKAVIAAIAYSLAMRLNDDYPPLAGREIIEEWKALHVLGIVRQKPILADQDPQP